MAFMTKKTKSIDLLTGKNQRVRTKQVNLLTNTENILTLDNLTLAIQNSVGGQGIEREEAKKMAEHMLNFFGYSDRIIDNMLEPEDRDLFYMMEDSGLLITEREETTLHDGREWRINYWLFDREKIQDLINNGPQQDEKEEEETSVYEDLPDEVWERTY
jgi:hypothetical protein